MTRRALAALFLACSACGGDPAPVKAPVDNRPPPPEVMALVVHLVAPTDSTARSIAEPYKFALARSGFRVAEGGDPHDVEINLAASATPIQSFWQVQVNGQTRVKLDVRVTVAVVGLEPQARVDMLQSQFEMVQGEEPDAGEIGRLVLQFAKSPNLARWAASRQSTHSVTDDQSSKPYKATSGADDSDWYKLKPVSCKVPIKLDACDPIRAYLVRWPQGVHADEARNTLEAAEPALEKLQKDDNDWQAVRPDDCRRKKTADACAGVEVYLHRYPAGLHTDEAKRLMGN